jgi:putative acetyltransferase
MPQAPHATFVIRGDDLSGEPTRQLIARHLQGMHAHSPACSVHALDIDRLRDPSVTFWSAWIGSDIAGCGALKRLDGTQGEIKSMRVADAFLGKGVGRAMLDHILAEARALKLGSLWLETGSSDAFLPALKLYESAGFTRCGPFGSYVPDPFSIFMTRTL